MLGCSVPPGDDRNPQRLVSYCIRDPFAGKALLLVLAVTKCFCSCACCPVARGLSARNGFRRA